MQWSKTIMAFLILLFSFSPCAEAWDNDNCASENGIQAESEPTDAHQKTDTCTPFCACACCHIPITSTFVLQELVENDPPIDFLVEASASISPPLFEIWQPPKI